MTNSLLLCILITLFFILVNTATIGNRLNINYNQNVHTKEIMHINTDSELNRCNSGTIKIKKGV